MATASILRHANRCRRTDHTAVMTSEIGRTIIEHTEM